MTAPKVISDIAVILQGPINTFFNNAIASGTVNGVALQAPALLASLIAAEPQVESAGIKDELALAQVAFNNWLASITESSAMTEAASAPATAAVNSGPLTPATLPARPTVDQVNAAIANAQAMAAALTASK